MRIPKKHIEIAETLTTLLDNQFSIFGIKIGIDPFLDLVPGLGNIVGAGLACYHLYLAIIFHLPAEVVGRMIGNILLDYLIGFLPLIGFISDIVFKANVRNLELLKKYAQEGNVIEGDVLS